MNSFLSKIGYSAVYVYVEFFFGLVASIFIARTLGPEQYGLYSYFIKISAILLVFINAGLSTGVLRFLAEFTYNADNKYVVAYNVYRFFSRIQLYKCVTVILFFYLVLHRLAGVIIDPGHEALLLLFLGGVVFKSYYMFRVGAFKGLERFDRLAWTVLAATPIYVLLVLVGAHYKLGIEFFAVVYLLTSALYWAVSYVLISPFLKKGEVELGDSFKKRAVSYVRIVTVNSVLSSLVLGYVEIFYLKMMGTNVEIGYFNIGLTMSAAAVNMVPGIYNAILMPAIVKNSVQNNGEQTENARLFLFGTVRHMLILTLFVVVPAAYYSHNLVVLFYGKAFAGAVMPLQLMLLASITTAVTYPAIAYFVSKDRQADMLKVYSVTLILSVCMGYMMIRTYGLYGAVISNILVTLFAASCLFVMLLRDFKGVPHVGLLAKTVLVSIIAIAGTSLVKIESSLFLEMVVGSAVYALLFVVLARVLNIFTDQEMQSMVRVLNRFRKG